jgi:hypothetical protein
MKAGRELDALVGSEIFNFQWYSYDGHERLKGLIPNKEHYSEWIENLKKYNNLTWHDSEPQELKLGAYEGPNYSTNLSDASQVLEKFGEILVRRRLNGTDYRVWIELDNGSEIYEHAKTAPLAICLAALKTRGKPKGGGV